MSCQEALRPLLADGCQSLEALARELGMCRDCLEVLARGSLTSRNHFVQVPGRGKVCQTCILSGDGEGVLDMPKACFLSSNGEGVPCMPKSLFPSSDGEGVSCIPKLLSSKSGESGESMPNAFFVSADGSEFSLGSSIIVTAGC
jgi:hypothetical protein